LGVASFKTITCGHADGNVVIYSTQPQRGPDHPLVIMMHGALRTAETLVDWADLLADVADVVLVDMPGHGRSADIANATVPLLTTVVQRVINQLFSDRRVLLVGESFGGTIALSMAGQQDIGPIRAVFAADPPLTTAKQWRVHENFRTYIAKTPQHTYAPILSRDFFGTMPDGVAERIYYPLLGALKVPTLIASGDVPLQPPRSMYAIANVIDDVDRFVMATYYADKVRYAQLNGGGHLLMVWAKAQCLAIIRQLLAEHVAPKDGDHASLEAG
jgi:pimeloyl-ACP methyl ester carboxylesterase